MFLVEDGRRGGSMKGSIQLHIETRFRCLAGFGMVVCQ